MSTYFPFGIRNMTLMVVVTKKWLGRDGIGDAAEAAVVIAKVAVVDW